MRLRLLVASLFVLVSLPLFAAKDEETFRPATPAELALKDVPFAPGAPAVILDWVRQRNDNMSAENEYVRIKILRDDGKKYADIELPYMPGVYGSMVRNIKARTIRPDGTIKEFDGKIYDKLVVKVYGARVMNKTFTLPDAGPGSIIEYAYRRDWNWASLRSTHWNVQRELPVLHQRLVFTPFTQDYACFYAYKGLPAGKKPERNKDRFELELDNMAALPDEPFSPPSEFVSAKVLFYYQLSQKDAKEFWKEYPKDSSKAVEAWLKETDVVRTAATQAIQGATTDDAKLRALYAKVQSLRNLTWEKDKSEQESKREKLRDNRSATDVLKNGYGYRTELNRAFLAMARAAGFDAQPVDTSQRDEIFTDGLPDASSLEEICAVMVGDKMQVFDPGTAFLPFGQLAWDNAACAAIRMPKKGEAVWVQTPALRAADARMERIADLKLDGDVLSGTVRLVALGQQALTRRWDVIHSDDAEAKKKFEDDAKEWFPEGSTVKLTKLSGTKSSDEPLTAEFDVTISGLGSEAGSKVLLPLSVFTSTSKNHFASEKRSLDLFFKHGWETSDKVTVTLPQDYAVDSLPMPRKLDYGALQYANDWKRADGKVTFTRTMMVDANYIPADKYPAVRAFFSGVVTADQDAAVLKAK